MRKGEEGNKWRRRKGVEKQNGRRERRTITKKYIWGSEAEMDTEREYIGEEGQERQGIEGKERARRGR